MQSARGWTQAMVAAALVLALSGCTTLWRAEFFPPEKLATARASAKHGFLKAHTRDGRVTVWRADELAASPTQLEGDAAEWGPDRAVPKRKHVSVPLSEVALLEASAPHEVLRGDLITLGVLSAATVLVTAICAVDPQACGL